MKLVLCDTMLFNNTVYYNIAYGDLSASPTDVKEAAEKLSDLDETMIPKEI